MQTSAISFTFTVTGALTITNAVGVPAAVQGQPYSYQFTTSGGTAPITFSATGLPAGLSISSGGLAADNTVSFLLSGLGGCTNAAAINALIPAQLANTTTALGVSTTFKTELGTSIDGGSASLTKIVQFAPSFAVTTKADTGTTAATLASGFKSLTADVTLGTVVVAAGDQQLRSDLRALDLIGGVLPSNRHALLDRRFVRSFLNQVVYRRQHLAFLDDTRETSDQLLNRVRLDDIIIGREFGRGHHPSQAGFGRDHDE
jgi:hypothetical protein